MSGYKELIHSYRYDIDSLGVVSGRRVFIKVATGGVSLPVVGTSLFPNELGANFTGVICRKMSVVRDTDDRNYQYHFEYSSRPPGTNNMKTGVSNDPGDRSVDVQAEMLAFEDQDQGGWDAFYANGDFGFPLTDRTIYKRTVLIPFSIPRANLSTSQYTTLLNVVKDRAGTINAAAFEGFNIGQVLFEGLRGGTFTDQNNVKKWNVELIFKARLLTGEWSESTAITKDDWNFIWSSYWVMPKNADNQYLYRKTDFSSLL